MTDLRQALSVLSVILVFGMLLNLRLLVTAFLDWRHVERNRINGARQTIAIAMIRRHLFRALLQFGLLWLYTPRVVFNQPASPAVAFLVGIVLVGVLVGEPIADALDRRVIRWFLRDKP